MSKLPSGVPGEPNYDPDYDPNFDFGTDEGGWKGVVYPKSVQDHMDAALQHVDPFKRVFAEADNFEYYARFYRVMDGVEQKRRELTLARINQKTTEDPLQLKRRFVPVLFPPFLEARIHYFLVRHIGAFQKYNAHRRYNGCRRDRTHFVRSRKCSLSLFTPYIIRDWFTQTEISQRVGSARRKRKSEKVDCFVHVVLWSLTSQ